MGNLNSGNSNEKMEGLSSDLSNKVRFIHEQIDKFYVSELTKQQFTNQLFAELQKIPHPEIGSIRISRSFILERFFQLLSYVQSILNKNSRTKCVNCKELKDFVELIHKNPEKAIEKSFQLLDLDHDKCITDAEFLNYMDNCLISLMAALQKDISDQHFKISLKDWLSKNRKIFFDETLRLFHSNKRSDPNKWLYNDFKRWILSGENWTMDVQLGVRKYKVPINLLCLFGIPKPISTYN